MLHRTAGMHHNGGFERALIPHQIETVRGDMEKLKARVKGERREREALSELTGVHSDVFVDVQKKLESHTQRLKTHEVQMAEHVDETSERIIAIDVGLAALTRESKRVRTLLGNGWPSARGGRRSRSGTASTLRSPIS